MRAYRHKSWYDKKIIASNFLYDKKEEKTAHESSGRQAPPPKKEEVIFFTPRQKALSGLLRRSPAVSGTKAG